VVDADRTSEAEEAAEEVQTTADPVATQTATSSSLDLAWVLMPGPTRGQAEAGIGAGLEAAVREEGADIKTLK
jgi:hypothetical protein